jgi:ubiquinone/menaquinone biosynthesis C-methylase UbiE
MEQNNDRADGPAPDARLLVSDERWRVAQDAERAFWVSHQTALADAAFRRPLWKWPLRRVAAALGLRDYDALPTGDDHNTWWRSAFDNYALLPRQLDNVLELGCGPHTNLRLIMDGRNIGHAIASDPLARQYVRLPRTWLRYAWSRGIVMLDDHPAEECPFASDYFGLVVMTNVLDHVRDARLCLEQAIRVTKKGGLLLLGQDLATDESLRQRPTGFDIPHPIAIKQALLDEVLTPRFEPKLQKVLSRDEGRDPHIHAGAYIFIGQKK